MLDRNQLEQILDEARWAPSGDNAQPWRFEITPAGSIVIHVRDESDSNVYDKGGAPTLVSVGCLVECIRLAASRFGRSIHWQYSLLDAHTHKLNIEFATEGDTPIDPLRAFVGSRSVDRRPYALTRITSEQKQSLGSALGDGYEIHWFESLSDRFVISQLCMRASHIRLSIPEAHAIHVRIIDWQNRLSEWGIPASAIGLDPITLGLMKWALKNWDRVAWMNRYLNGTLIPRIEMDLLPGLFCGAHFMIFSKNSSSPLTGPLDCIDFGIRFQRLWLTVAQLGLVMQPEFAPVIFSRYGRASKPYSVDPEATSWARHLAERIDRLSGPSDSRNLAMMGRIGTVKKRQQARSIRRPLSEMIIDGDSGG